MKMIRIVFLICLIFGAGVTQAQRFKGKHRVVAGPAAKVKAKKVIRRTAVVIHRAYKLTKENKVYTGNLAKAVRHQRYARILFRKGNFVRSVHQSRMARRLAFLAIQANKGTVAKDEQFADDEKVDDGTNPSDEELSKELPEDKVTDEELINSELTDIDLSDSD
jgi:hypothetical protein